MTITIDIKFQIKNDYNNNKKNPYQFNIVQKYLDISSLYKKLTQTITIKV